MIELNKKYRARITQTFRGGVDDLDYTTTKECVIELIEEIAPAPKQPAQAERIAAVYFEIVGMHLYNSTFVAIINRILPQIRAILAEDET